MIAPAALAFVSVPEEEVAVRSLYALPLSWFDDDEGCVGGGGKVYAYGDAEDPGDVTAETMGSSSIDSSDG